MNDVEFQRLRERQHELSNLHMSLAGKMEAHLAGCEQQNKYVNASLVRLEAGLIANVSGFNKFIMLVLGAQGAVLLAIFAGWLATGGYHH